MKIDFLIFYEHKNREFESIALLKHELVRRGYTVDFFSFNEIHNKKKRKKLFNNVNVAVMPSLYHNEEILNFVYGVAGKVKNIVNLRWEQIFSNQRERNFDYYVYPKGNAKYGYHCCWGEKPLKLLNDSGVEKNKLFVTGPIHLDFLRNEFKGFYKNRAELLKQYGVNTKKKCILFVSSFATSSMDKWALNYIYSQYDEEEKEYSKKSLACEIESKKLIVKWLVELAEKKDCTIIYRPHPAEAKTEQIEKIKTIHNIKVIGDENIKQWFLTCDQVYTWKSTSIAEASVADISCAILRPIKVDSIFEYPIYEDMPKITDYQELNEYYENSIDFNSRELVNNKQLKTYLSVDSKNPSYKRTADVLEQALKDEYYFSWENFDSEELKSIEKKILKPNFYDIFTTILICPFYNFSISRRVVSRFFSKLTDRYLKIKSSKKPPISNEEFQNMEEKISTVLAKNGEK